MKHARPGFNLAMIRIGWGILALCFCVAFYTLSRFLILGGIGELTTLILAIAALLLSIGELAKLPGEPERVGPRERN